MTVSPSSLWTRCLRGHDLTLDGSTYLHLDGRGGRHRRCRKCKQDQNRESARRNPRPIRIRRDEEYRLWAYGVWAAMSPREQQLVRLGLG